MQKLFILISGLALSAHLMADIETLDSLTDLRWKNRVILVDKATELTVTDLEARQAEFDERQLLWFCLVNGEIRTNYGGDLGDGLQTQLEESYFEKSGFPVLLVGKDAGVKSRDRSLDIDNYLIQIDSMPMRQSEMQHSTPD